MRSLFLLFTAAIVTGFGFGFGFGITATSSAQNAADLIIESRAAEYCEKGFTEFCP